MNEKSNLISFDNTEVAYRSMSDKDLKKAYYMFKLMSYNNLVNIGNFMIPLLLNLRFPIKTLIKNTVYKQFCGGETLTETLNLINKLKGDNIEVLLNYSVEGLTTEKGFQDTFKNTLEAIQFSKNNPSIRAICIKFTGYAGTGIWTKIQNQESLTKAEEREFSQAKMNIDKLCEEAVNCNVHLYIDAEESWFQDSIDSLVDEMMEKYNKSEAYIFNTFQLYRNDKLEHFKKSTERAKARSYILGAKIVRGAYVEKENDYYKNQDKSSPINSTKRATDIEFDHAVIYAVENIEYISLCCASHNENSNQLYIQKLKDHNIPLNHKHVNASQLLGMSDNISYNLSEQGMNVAKYVPYGPVKEVIPYLLRRAQENTSVEGQTGRELNLLEKEMKRRGL